MSIVSQTVLAYKALAELGFRPVGLYALYRFGLLTGHYQRVLDAGLKKLMKENANKRIATIFSFPSREDISELIGEAGFAEILAQADEISSGSARIFGGEPMELDLGGEAQTVEWSAWEVGKVDPASTDIKLLWEPARFGWALTLGRAYLLTGEAKYPETFWKLFDVFIRANPPYKGPQWSSAQEVALRLMAFGWCGNIFASSPASTPERMACLTQAIAVHAARIPPTLVYARSQRNNHLLSEAAGLLTAGLALPDHPQSARWRNLGWMWFTKGLQDQIDGYGEYSQHSTNYHRLMLQLVLWVNMLIRSNDFIRSYRWPRPVHEAIARSVHWLLALLDSVSGCVPNLGANDGAYIFPLTVCPFQDFRPVLHAAARAFLDYDLPHGEWDEMSLWFGIPIQDKRYVQLPRYLGDQLYGRDSWGSLRTAQFTTRPSHADQLHLDLWWHGLNVAQDAGTYLYNATSPWDNSLTQVRVHNTVMVDGLDQMTRAGRFLYLDWVDSYRQDSSQAGPEVLQMVRARCRNFHLHYRHTRRVSVLSAGGWRVEDELLQLHWLPLPSRRSVRVFRLHWLLQDWQWEIDDQGSIFEICLKSPYGPVRLRVGSEQRGCVTLGRAGSLLYEAGLQKSSLCDPTRGWVSPTYGIKVPALSLAVEIASADDVQFTSEFLFP